MEPRIAVVGGGSLGLMAIKNLLDGGFRDVTCFESRPYAGGLWRSSGDGATSVTETTRFNSSRFRAAISDFPWPDDTDDYPTWRQVHAYLEAYADAFGLRGYVRLGTKVERVVREGGRWVLDVRCVDGSGEVRRESFDKVMMATGTFTTPKIPKIAGIAEFEGRVIHSIDFNRYQDEMRGKRVLLVGIHATTQDVAMTLEKQGASHVYASHRNGVRLLSRYDPDGRAFDIATTLNMTRVFMFLSAWLPRLYNWLIDLTTTRLGRIAFPHAPASLSQVAVPSMATTTPFIADEMYHLMQSGFCEPVPAITRVVGPRSVELRDGRVLDSLDAIIYCTGYDLSSPLVEPEHQPYPDPGEPARLYRGTFPLHPDAAVRESLAFLGHGFPFFPGLIQLELVVMAVVQVWRGASSLPGLAEMERWREGWLAWRAGLLRGQEREATFYVGTVPLDDHLRWFDWAAGTGVFSHFGVLSRRAWAFWWRDRELYNQCASGCFSPAVWRLFETGKRKAWAGAREQIVKDDLDARRAARRRLEQVRVAEAKKTR